jgi:hypothetical protein
VHGSQREDTAVVVKRCAAAVQAAVAALACAVSASIVRHPLSGAHVTLYVGFVISVLVSSRSYIGGAGGEVYSLSSIFIVAGALLLAPVAFDVLLVIPATAYAVRRHKGWSDGLANWANLVLAATTAHLLQAGFPKLATAGAGIALGSGAGAAAFVGS